LGRRLHGRNSSRFSWALVIEKFFAVKHARTFTAASFPIVRNPVPTDDLERQSLTCRFEDGDFECQSLTVQAANETHVATLASFDAGAGTLSSLTRFPHEAEDNRRRGARIVIQ
jgi:hypothetical protein